ncbi:MAG: hypothetical protein EHM45_13695 [Desulfobacteraceae bacterium]|nr:MAG: hypothetical protein EHM45_13695 [Desulfobacteraceae bacterium]
MNRFFIALSLIGAFILFSFGNVYACDTGTCPREAQAMAQTMARDQGLTGGSAVFQSAGCEYGYCKSVWVLYAERDGVSQFLDYYTCQSWSDYCWESDFCSQCPYGCYRDNNNDLQCYDYPSGGGGGGGEGNDGGTCYIGFGSPCPITCVNCVRVPYAQ